MNKEGETPPDGRSSKRKETTALGRASE